MAYNNVVRYKIKREIEDGSQYRFMRKLHVTRNFIDRLGLEAELEGHSGCVNCLEWNDSGNLLASGSDDLQIILWEPFTRKKLLNIQSGHHGNIFSLKFLPHSNDQRIISGAADFRIRIYDIQSKETVMNCSCHWGRVKRLAATSNVPHMFWSAAEDGMIMQFDLRESHQCSNICKNVLVNLVYHVGRNAEAKCLAVNPLRPELLAVGANDPYVRLYDRRMIKPTTVKYPREHHSAGAAWNTQPYVEEMIEHGDDNLPSGCVSYFVAGHLPLKQDDFRKRYRTLTSTYVAFSPDGNDVLANLGGEQIYLFNILSKRKLLKVITMNFSANNQEANSEGMHDNKPGCSYSDGISASKTCSNGRTTNGVHFSILPSDIPDKSCGRKQTPQPTCQKFQSMKRKANEAFDKREFTLAISLYSKAIVKYPDVACLYANRAAAYLKREWDGDYYAAIRDCYAAMRLDPEYLKAYFRLAQCLHKLHWGKAAMECLAKIRERFPNYARSRAFEAFETDIKVSVYADLEGMDSDSSDEPDATVLSSSSTSQRRLNNAAKALMALSEKERKWRTSSFDYEARFCGHCNTTTDIKEANFFGSDGQYIVAGSDDGSIFIWDRVTTNISRVLRGDDSIVNCLQPHQATCLLATSGIDPVVRLWGPKAEDGSTDEREIVDLEDAAVANQRRMNADPLEIMLMNMGYRLPSVLDLPNV
uniref:WD and tetratricopeptide repeats protein 1 n=1 Tax=Parasteatoda tepidariorum TaxID=114398 RepID=A0A2L2YFC7_PARTP